MAASPAHLPSRRQRPRRTLLACPCRRRLPVKRAAGRGGGKGEEEEEEEVSILSERERAGAEQTFQDELAKDSVAWFGRYVFFVILSFIYVVTYNPILAAFDDKNHWQGSEFKSLLQPLVAAGGIIASTLSVLWLVLRYRFKQGGNRFSGFRRFLLCLPIPISFVGALISDTGFMEWALGNLHGRGEIVDQSTIVTLIISHGSLNLLVVPAHPGIKVGAASLLLYVAILAYAYSRQPRGIPADFAIHYIPTVSFLILAHFIKRSKEGMHRRLVFALHAQRAKFVAEKVKRCQAEFRLDAPKQSPGQDRHKGKASESSCPSTLHRSAMTAPAALVLITQRGREEKGADGLGTACDGPDCLPETSLVQVEGSSDPQELGSLEAGRRVLCLDHLSGKTCYKDIVEIEMVDAGEEDPREWVTCTLADRTCITMTADHPMRVTGADSAERVVPAGEVQPGGDSVMCIRAVLQEVVAVDVSTEAPPVSQQRVLSGAPRRVSLSVEQGERFSVLVSPPCNASPLASLVAVGSADATQGNWRVSKTVLEYCSPHTQPPGGGLKRSLSDSDLPRSTGAQTSRSQQHVNQGSPDSSWISSLTPSLPEDEGDLDQCTVYVGSQSEKSIIRATEFKGTLPPPLGRGLASIGTRWHPLGCAPCEFQVMRRGCLDGRFCSRCHSEEHTGLSQRQRKLLAMKNLKSQGRAPGPQQASAATLAGGSGRPGILEL